MGDVHHESVFFTGRVQGVGFRYTTLQVAKEFDVSGWVKNLPDGRVQVEAEGSQKSIKDFFSAIEERMHGHIRKIERKSGVKLAELQGFTIR
jgi:acylphosphatase